MTADESPLPGFTGGTEWMIDASGCIAGKLRDADEIELICTSVIDDLGLNVVGRPQRHQFPPPGGVTLLYLLSESHLACHTYPEYEFATFNLYCCRRRLRWNWEEELERRLGAAQVCVREWDRDLQPIGRPEALR